MANPSSRRRRFPASELFRFLVLPVVLTIIVILVFMKPWRDAGPVREGAFEQIELVQKGGLSAVTSLFGGPTGSVWYTPDGAELRLRLGAEHLDSGRRYIFELQVDSTVYDVASLVADGDGRVALDSAFAGVAEGICVGANYDPPMRFQAGRSYTLGFMIKRDGNPTTGTQRVPRDGGTVELRCTGNGDGDYRYALMENRPGRFTAR
ncbi:MAG TPA: hypothetical protein VFR95_10385 [Gemmatimonadaceae bacterium]|nr:hypothetical protein [Gemmatimonadaceae bacterium]